ncbi:hypothetical protein KG090_03085 [Carnobacteriaceae bacterium zg-ZUI240]|nr:hypothetical protein [Carnobacteriaceae bacterium zg-ZUI240]
MKFKKIALVLFVILGALLSSMSSNTRSLYSTKADASTEYALLGNRGEQMTLTQTIIPDGFGLNQIEMNIQNNVVEDAAVEWEIRNKDNQVILSNATTLFQLLNDTKSKVTISLANVTNRPLNVENSQLAMNETYTFSIKGNIGGVFFATAPRYNNQLLRVNEMQTAQSLVVKAVYGIQPSTFFVLIGLLAYIVFFMIGMLKLFR